MKNVLDFILMIMIKIIKKKIQNKKIKKIKNNKEMMQFLFKIK